MIAYCDFSDGNPGTTCSWCGYPLEHSTKQPPKRRCISVIKRKLDFGRDDHCPHLLGPTEEDTAIRLKRGCRGNSRTSVWECDIHGRCTPYARSKDATIKACADCTIDSRQHT